MANYHILSADRHGNSFSVIMHFPVPDIANAIGRNYREVLIEWLGGSQPSQVPFIDGAEQTQLNAGELLEHSIRFNSNPGESLVQKQARIDALWESERTDMVERLSNELSYWGHNRVIP